MIKALAGGLCLCRDITCSGNDSDAFSLIISLNKYLANIMCDLSCAFAIRGLPAVIDTSLPHGYKKSEPYKVHIRRTGTAAGKSNGGAAKALHPRFGDGADIRHCKPGSSACCAAVLQGITRRLAPTGGVLGCRPWNHCPKKALTPPAVGLLPPAS